MLAAAAAAVTVLVARDPRLRAAAMVAALAFSGLRWRRWRRACRRGGGAGRRRGGGAGRARRRSRRCWCAGPALVGLLALGGAAVPGPADARRGDGEPAAAALRRDRGRRPGRGVALAAPRPRPGGARRRRAPVGRTLRHVQIALAAVVGLYALQAVYSTDLEVALKNVCLFYAPFAVLLRLLCDVEWNAVRLRHAFWLIAGLAVVFAAVGFYEYATRPPAALQRQGPGGQRPQALLPGQLAVLRPEHLRALPGADDDRPGRDARVEPRPAQRADRRGRAGRAVGGAGAVAVAVELRGAARRPGGARRAALEGAAGARAIAVLAALAVGVVLLSPARWRSTPAPRRRWTRPPAGASTSSAARCRWRATGPSGASAPGAFAERYRAREGVRSERVAAVSHTIPLTVAAEQGLIGLLAYLALMAASLRLVFSGVRPACAPPTRGSRRSRPRRSPRRSARSCCTPSCTRRSSRTPSRGRCWRSRGALRGAPPEAPGAPGPRSPSTTGFLPGPVPSPQGDHRRCRDPGPGRAGAAAAYFIVLKEPGDISNPGRAVHRRGADAGAEGEEGQAAEAEQLPLAALRLHEGPQPQLRPGEADPRAVPGQVEAQGVGADRVPARDRPGPHPAARRRRAAGLARPRHGQEALEAQARQPVGLHARRSRTAAST